MGKQIIDLEPYISGGKKMSKKCDHEGCKERKDITKEYIDVETQNNERRKTFPDFNPACDELFLFLGGWYCEEHIWDGFHGVCKYCHNAKFLNDWDCSIHQLVCSKKDQIPKDMNWWEWFKSVDWSKTTEYDTEVHYRRGN